MAHLLARSFLDFAPYPVLCSLAGSGALALWDGAARRSFRGPEAYWRCWRDPRWWALTLRLWLGLVLVAHGYTWLKLLVPYLNGANYDRTLWALEERLLGGYSPNALFLELFRSPPVLRFIDWSYHQLFLAGLYLFMAVFPVLRSTRHRLACMIGFAALWSWGAWLYVLVPCLGPCYWFPSVWKPYADLMPYTRAIQEGLLENYRAITLFRNWGSAKIHFSFGVAAFPSLHVASQVFLALWARRWNRWAGWAAWITATLLFVGSLVTGWHYLVDSLAGAGMAAACYWGALKLHPAQRPLL
jgi:hypothetical protein